MNAYTSNTTTFDRLDNQRQRFYSFNDHRNTFRVDIDQRQLITGEYRENECIYERYEHKIDERNEIEGAKIGEREAAQPVGLLAYETDARDVHERVFASDAPHGPCKRFRAAGPHPPFPPEGGQNSLTDGSDTILQSSNKSLTASTTNQIIENSQTQTSPTNFLHTNNQQTTSLYSSPTQQTSPTLTASTQSPDYQNLNGKRPYSQSFDIQAETTHFFPQLFSERKRDEKAQLKQDNQTAGKRVCKGCHLQYNKLKSEGFCHNCYKIYEAVDECVAKNGGYFRFIEQTCSIELICLRQHKWHVEFKTKQVKKWCKTCKRSDRDQRKEYYRRIDEQQQQEFERMQRELFNQARNTSFTYSEEEGTTIDDLFDHPSGDDTSFGIEFLQQILRGNEGEDRLTSADIMQQIVNVIMNESEYRLQRFFEGMEKEERMRAFRRLARMVHPDKNPHGLAKEAFQKLLSSSNRRISKSQMMWIFQFIGLLFGAEERQFFGQHQPVFA